MGAANDLVGTSYVVVEIDGAAVLENTSSDLTFGLDGRVTGRATINRVFGPYEADGDVLRLGPLAQTMMAGLPEAMAQERTLLERLDGELRVEVDADGRVRLVGPEGRSLTLVAGDLVTQE